MKPCFFRTRDRREFLCDNLRYAILAGLAVLGGALVAKQSDPLSPGSCLRRQLCQGCLWLDTCTLPSALPANKSTPQP
jgi:hypothetical protein